jgi:hypothetical protein
VMQAGRSCRFDASPREMPLLEYGTEAVDRPLLLSWDGFWVVNRTVGRRLRTLSSHGWRRTVVDGEGELFPWCGRLLVAPGGRVRLAVLEAVAVAFERDAVLVVDEALDFAEAMLWSLKTSPQRRSGLLLADDQGCALVSGADAWQDKVRGFAFEGM